MKIHRRIARGLRTWRWPSRVRHILPLGIVAAAVASGGVAATLAADVSLPGREPSIPAAAIPAPPPPPPPAGIPAGWKVDTFAGGGQTGPQGGGRKDGQGDQALFSGPESVAFDQEGNLVVADLGNNVVRKVSADGTVTTLAGTGAAGFADGPSASAQFNAPANVAVSPDGDIFVADAGNNRVRRIDRITGAVSTVAGSSLAASPKGQPLRGGFADGPASAAMFDGPVGLAFGPDGTLFVADKNSQRIRSVKDGIVRTVAGSGLRGKDDGPALVARFDFPTGIVATLDGRLFVSDQGSGAIREIASNGTVTTFVPSGILLYPAGLELAPGGGLFVADVGHHQIQRITPSGQVVGLAGNGSSGLSTGVGDKAQFSSPTDVALSAAGHLFVTDTTNNRIRVLAAPAGGN